MIKILLCCSNGFSTSVLVKNMRTYAQSIGKEVEINATSVDKVIAKKATGDVILLAPQVRFEIQNVKKKCPDIPSGTIPMKEYGRMDGEAVVKLAFSLLD